MVAVLDWRTLLRSIKGQPTIDVVFITNMRDEVDRRRFLGRWKPPHGHFNGPRYWFGNIAGRTRALDVTAADLATNEGRKKAKAAFLAATQWAHDRGARVVLLAAGTKRLFGMGGKCLKDLFPDMLFTIGDNGTAALLCGEILNALDRADLEPHASRICVIGPTGILGKTVVAQLLRDGYKVVGLSARGAVVGTGACTNIHHVGQVDAVVACTHAENVCLDREAVDFLHREGRKLLVIDVSEPSNMDYSTYRRCRDVVVRQDAGNAYSPSLRYVLGAVSYALFRLSRGVTFGCFAEAMVIAAEVVRGNGTAMRKVDWFNVSDDARRLVAGLFIQHGFGIPTPRCFGKPVESFDLRIEGDLNRSVMPALAKAS